MKLRNKILSGILAFTMITSLLPLSSLTAYAGSSSTGLSGRDLGASGNYLLNANKAVLKINASAITDDTREAQMANANYKYGNGSNHAMIEYPLMMQSRIRNYTSIGSPSISHDTQYISEGSNWSNDTLRNSMREEYQKWRNAIHPSGAWSGNIDNRRKWIYEYVNDDGNEGHLYINTPNSFNATDKNGRVVQYQSPSVFLEDTLSTVIALTDDGIISTKDAACFWKFYTSIAVGANADVDAWYSGSRGANEQPGYKLNDLLKSIKNNTNEKDRFMRGYIVALYATYGNNAVKKLTGNDFSKSGSNDWGNGNAWGDYKSLVVSKLESVPTGTNKVPGHPKIKEMLMSTDGWLAFLKSMDQLSGRSSSNTLYDYVNYGTMNRNKNNFSNYIYHYADIVRPAISPHRVRDNAASLSSTAFSGWGYYEFTGGTTTKEIDPAEVFASDTYTVATQATYSAYLISKEEQNTLNSTGTIARQAMQDQSDAFGDNGCVMSDLIYVSQPQIKKLNQINNVEIGFDKTIKLDSPVANTEFKLTKLSYYISNANGGASTYIQGSSDNTYKKFNDSYNYIEKEYGNIKNDTCLKSTYPYVEVSAADIKSALKNDDLAAKYRSSKLINDEGIAEGYWTSKDESGNITKHYYYVYQRDNSAASGYSIKKLNGKNMTTRKVDLGNTNYGTYSSGDLNEKSNNLLYLYLDNTYKPFYYRGGNWYYAPVERTTSILITTRGDYTACYGDSSSNVYKNIFKTTDEEVPVMKEYLLGKNYSTTDMTKKKLYSQIDDYTTGMAGSIDNRNYDWFSEQGDNGNGGRIKISNNDSVTYNSNSLIDNNGNYISGDKLKLSTTTSILTNLNRKLGYVVSFYKTSPIFKNLTGNASSDNNTFVDYALNVQVDRYNANNNKISNSGLSSKMTNSDQYYLGYSGGVEISSGSTYKGEKSPTSTSNTDLDPELTYSKGSFRKILASYKTYAYTLKSSLSGNAVPYYVGWLNTTNNSNAQKLGLVAGNTSKTLSSIGNTYFGFIRFGETGRFNANGEGHMKRLENNKGLPWSIAEVKTKSFNSNLSTGATYRFATTFVQNSYDVPLRTSANVHSTKDISAVKVSNSYIKGNGNNVSLSYQYGTNSTSGLIKSGNKVFLGVYPEVKMWAEEDKTKTGSDTTTYSSVMTVGSKMRYIPAMTYTTAKFGDLEAKVDVIGNAVAYDTRAKKLATSLGTADTQVLYSGTSINGSSTVKASGTVQSYVFSFQGNGVEGGTLNGVDVRTAWGNAGYRASDAASASMDVLLKNYVVDQKNYLGIYNGSHDIQNSYKESTVTSSGGIGTLSADSTSLSRDVIYYQVKIKGGRVTEVEVKAYADENHDPLSLIKFSVSGTNITYVNNSRIAFNALTFGTGNETKTNIARAYLADRNGGSWSWKNVTTVAADVKNVLTHMKLIGTNTIIEKAFEWGTGVTLPDGLTSTAEAVDHSFNGTKYSDTTKRANKMSYSEDCSVLQIRSYTANIKATSSKSTFTEQIPINLGPATPKDKNDYFSKGYCGFVNTIAKIKVKDDITCNDGSVVAADSAVKTATSTHETKSGGTVIVKSNIDLSDVIPDFIIGDVPISEATNG